MTQRLEFARAFAGLNLPVFPCKEDKKPCVEDWPNVATTDLGTINTWAQQFPDCRWGVACGKAGLFVVDSDNKPDANGENTLELLTKDHEPLPPTYTVRTKGGGLHRYFWGKGKTGAGDLGPAVDTRSVGGYVIIPDGVDYVELNHLPPAPVPQWILDKTGPRQREQALDFSQPAPGVEVDRHERLLDAIEYVTKHAPGAPEGERDVTAYKVACQVRDYGLSHQAAVRVMTEYWAERDDVELGGDFGLREVQWKVAQAYKTAQNRLGAGLPEAMFSPAGAEGLQVFADWSLDPASIPKREWLLGTWMIKRFLTVTVAPGGTGKSNHSILEALSVITGLDVSGNKVHERGKVWIHNGEDPLDEVFRRVVAACMVHKIDTNLITNNLICTSGRTTPLTLVRDVNRNPVVDQATLNAVRETIRKHEIKLWVIDPFVDLHTVNENDNGPINLLAKTLSRLAEETGCAIHVVHHTRKKGKDGALNDMDMGRGASALMSAARIGRNLCPMSEKQGENYVLSKPYFWYVGLNSSKANLAQPGEHDQWYEKVDVELPNGDHVGTMRPIKLQPLNGRNEEEARMLGKVVEIVDQRGGRVSLEQVIRAIVDAQPAITELTDSSVRRRLATLLADGGYVEDAYAYRIADATAQERCKHVVIRMLVNEI